MKLNILFEDSHIIVCEKPVGISSQGSRGFDLDLTDLLKQHLAKQSKEKGEPYLGVIHRLDRPVGGVMVYAKTPFAAADLSKQVASYSIKKCYYAILCGIPKEKTATLIDYLAKDGKTNISSVVASTLKEGKKAQLSYKIMSTKEYLGEVLSLANVELHTGRHHQIRLQFANINTPLWGDTKYNHEWKKSPTNHWVNIGLFSYCLEFTHPKTKKLLTFTLKPTDGIFELFDLKL
ncbi:MAG: RluA family pseudouridine synthase [Clostridiales bacterium]|nr:RluA family pseudouridine synthase [Clostridiales bacterium]